MMLYWTFTTIPPLIPVAPSVRLSLSTCSPIASTVKKSSAKQICFEFATFVIFVYFNLHDFPVLVNSVKVAPSNF